MEGGANRGVFTAGALDFLMEQEYYIPHVIGVSAGACNALDYVSRQIGRTRDCMIVTDEKNRYVNKNIKTIVEKKALLDMDMVFERYPYEIFPFDFDTYFRSEIECEIVTTNCETGQAEYMTETKDGDRLMKICRASSSMPLVSPIVNIDGVPYLDGGLADSIPVKRALQKGNEKIVLILTRNPGYRKKPVSKAVGKLYRRSYQKYPNLMRTCIRRSLMYNQQMKLVEQLEEEGKIFVLRPLIPTVSRLEKNYDTLMYFYEHGYRLMKRQYEALERYLEK